jgi:hypothetical protein
MTEFNIEVTYMEQKIYNVSADTLEEAVEIASVMAENDCLNTFGGVSVMDANYDPVDTWEGTNERR